MADLRVYHWPETGPDPGIRNAAGDSAGTSGPDRYQALLRGRRLRLLRGADGRQGGGLLRDPDGRVRGQGDHHHRGPGRSGHRELDPIQEAFLEHNAFQCGFCTPGIIIAVKSLLNANPHPTEDEIKEALSGNFCRCISHYQVIEAVQSIVKGGEQA